MKEYRKNYNQKNHQFKHYINLVHIWKKKLEKAETKQRIKVCKQKIKHYKKLLEKSKFGFFKLIAEAGLYRSISQKNKDKT